MGQEFIGAGWAFPLRTDRTGSIALVHDQREIEESIHLILATSPGERPMRPEFGCAVHDYVFAPADAATAGDIAYAVRVALDRWEPRIDVENVLVHFDGAEEGMLLIDVQYTIRGTRRPQKPCLPVLRHSAQRRGGRFLMLPSPNLDDRRFQDLVDDAKRMVAHYCPEWTDHNVSDPGITLIESFAFMVDQLFYRLNRVPDRLYVAFLELLGVTLHPPTAASVELLMWLSAPQPDTVVIPQGTEVSTRRTEEDEAVVFATTRELSVPPRRLDYVMTQGRGGVPVPHSEALHGDGEFACFGTPPVAGEVLLLGFNDQAPSCVVALRFDCEVRGVGVNPRNPPLVWEAWDGSGWVPCELDSDGTGGLNRPGDVVIHVPHTHAASLLGGVRAGWLRCRVVDPTDGYPPYSASPTVRSAHGFTIGGFVPAVHAETITDEVIGMSEGVPGQSFPLGRHPVVPGGDRSWLKSRRAPAGSLDRGGLFRRLRSGGSGDSDRPRCRHRPLSAPAVR